MKAKRIILFFMVVLSTLLSNNLKAQFGPLDDFDGDLILNKNDIDLDNDGIPNALESPDCYYRENSFSSGNRVGNIILTTSIPDTTGSLDALVDGDTSANGLIKNGGYSFVINPGVFLGFEFPNPIEIDAITLYFNGGSLLVGDLRGNVQGSNDGSNWDDLTGLNVQLIADGAAPQSISLSPTNAYKYYRINATSDRIADGGALREVEFGVVNFERSLQRIPGCSDDVDNDGVENVFDLDSDGDNCSDAYESNATTNSTLNYQFPTTNVGANGLDDSLETSPDSGVVISTINGVQPYYKGISKCADTDLDGILDVDDLDDDNDGVLDSEEQGACYYLGGADLRDLTFSNSLNNGEPVISVTSNTLTGAKSTGSGYRSTYSDQSYALPVYLEFTPASISSFTMFGLIPTGGTQTPTNWTDAAYKFFFPNATTYDIRDNGAAVTSTDTFVPTDVFSILIDASGNLTMSKNGTPVYTKTMLPTTTYKLAISQNTTVPQTFENVTFNTFDQLLVYCDDIDTDGDTISNRLDLDSDNDGCSDAYEAGATANLTTDYQFPTTNVGTNGLDDSLETSTTPESGQINYVSTYNTYAIYEALKACLDTDNDGVRDIFDIDDDNDGILDAIESPSCYFSAEESRVLTSITSEANYAATEDISTLIDRGQTAGLFNFVAGTTKANLTVFEVIPTKPTAINAFVVEMSGASNLFGGTPNTVTLQGWDGSVWQPLSATLTPVRVGTTYTIDVTQNQGVYEKFRVFGNGGTLIANNVEEVYLVVNDALYQSSVNQKNTCSSDLDGDTFANHVDLDSDGDGCSDAYETRLTSSLTPDYQFPTTNVGSNGLVDALETAPDSGIINYNASFYHSYAQSALFNACLDSDNDGVSDIADIDDDNDGIIDEIESPTCFYTPDDLQLGDRSSDIKVTTSLTNFSGAISSLVDGDSATDGIVFTAPYNFVNIPTDLLTVQFPVPVELNNLTLHFNGGTLLVGALVGTVQASNDGITWTNVTAINTTLINDGASPQTISLMASGDFIFYRIYATSDRVALNGSLREIEFSISTTNYSSSTRPKSTCNEDLDGDTVNNHLDLDSDGDGCSDAYETSATNDSTTNFSFTGVVGSNGLLDSLESAADSGIINYTSTSYYAFDEELNLCTDTDNDGIPDLRDIDDDNDGVLDDVEMLCQSATSASTNFVASPPGNQLVEGSLTTVRGAGTFAIDLSDASANLASGNFYYGSGVSYLWNDASQLFNSSVTITPDAESVIKVIKWGPSISGQTDASYDNNEQTITLNWTPTVQGIVRDPNGQLSILDGTVISSGASISQTVDQVNGAGTWYIEFLLNGYNKAFVLNTTHVSDSGSNFATEGYSFTVDLCSSVVDTNGDGIPNQLALDSDGDGCSDAFEAGATSDLSTDYSFPTSSVGANGLSDLVETSPDSGVINYASLYSTYAVNRRIVACKSDLVVTVTSDVGNGASVFEGDTVNFTVTVLNNGPILSSTNTQLLDDLLTSFNFVSATPSLGTYSTGVWDIGTLTVGQSATLTFVATVQNNVSGVISLNETAIADIAESDATADDESEAFRVNNIDEKLELVDIYLDEDGNISCDGDNDTSNDPDFLGITISDQLLTGGTQAAILYTDVAFSTETVTSVIENEASFNVPGDILPTSALITISGTDYTSNSTFESNSVFGSIVIDFTSNTYSGYLYDFGDAGSLAATGADFTWNNVPIGSLPGSAGEFVGRADVQNLLLSRIGNEFTITHSGTTGVDQFTYLIEYYDGFAQSKDLINTQADYLNKNSSNDFTIDISSNPEEIIVTASLADSGSSAFYEWRGNVRIVMLRQADGSYVATGEVMYDHGNTQKETTNYVFKDYQIESSLAASTLTSSAAIGDTNATSVLADFNIYQSGSSIIIDRTANLESNSYALFNANLYEYIKDTNGAPVGSSVQSLGTTFAQGDLNTIGGADFCFPIAPGAEAGTINFAANLIPSGSSSENENGGMYTINVDFERDPVTGVVTGGTASGYIAVVRIGGTVDLVSFKNIDMAAPGIQLVEANNSTTPGVISSANNLNSFVDPQAGGVTITLEDCGGGLGIRVRTVPSNNSFNEYVFEAANAQWVGRIPVVVENVPDFISFTGGTLLDGGKYAFSVFDLAAGTAATFDLPDNYNNADVHLTSTQPLQVYFSDNPGVKLGFNVFVLSNTVPNAFATCPPQSWSGDPSTETPALADEGEQLTKVNLVSDTSATVVGNTVKEILSTSQITPGDNTNGMAIATIDDQGLGTWQYSLDNGTTWTDIPNVSPTNALLVRNTDKIRFVPDGSDVLTGTDPRITYFAWNESATDKTAGSLVNASLYRGWTDTDANGTKDFDYSTEFSRITDYAIITFESACYDLPATSASLVPSKHGITLLKRAGSPDPSANLGWPKVRESAFTVLESNSKGFVVTRMTSDPASTAAPNYIGNIQDPIDGMMIYDEFDACLKIYTVTDSSTVPVTGSWQCYRTPTCP